MFISSVSTSPAQMGLTARTCMQIAAEGLVTPNDFEDFNNEANLEGLFKLLLKPPKVMVGVGNAAVLTEAAAYVIPAKTMICLHGVRLIMAYYRMVGRQDVRGWGRRHPT